MDRRRAERLFLNAVGLKRNAKARTTPVKNKRSRFDENAFVNFNSGKICCSSALGKGKTVDLSRFKNPNQRVNGVVAYISQNYMPLKNVCSLQTPSATIWLLVNSEQAYIRCIF